MSEYQNTAGSGSGQVLKDFAVNSDISQKLDYKFGHDVSRTIKNTWAGTTSYYFLRNTRFQKNRRIANGRMNMQQFVDQLQMNSKTNYVNINWKAILLASTAISRLVGKWMGRGEKVHVKGVDLTTKIQRQDAADQAEFVLDNKGMLEELEQASGVPMVPTDQFIAADKDELDEWVSEFNRTPEEIKYELGTNNILSANGWFDVLKDKMLHDSAEVGLVATETYMNSEGEIIIEWIRPENTIYAYTEYDDFRDTSYRGRIKAMKIGQLKKYCVEYGGKLTKEDFYTLIQTAKEYQYIDKIRYLENWNVNMYMPYDDWTVDVMFYELKSFDCDDYTITKTKLHNSTLIQKGNLGPKLKENQSVIRDEKWNIYRGVYAMTADIQLEWGIKENMIVPQDPKEIGNAEFSYSFYMYQNYEMRNIAIPEKIEEPLEQMILARLKIQQLVAKLKPIGAAINVDALQELDLGLATLTSPMEAERIYAQTGNMYYKGRDAEGRPIPVPIQELSNSGFLPQMQGLVQIYQFHYQVLKDELGNDPNLNQQAAQPRVTAGNVQASQQLSDDATDYMYDAYLYCMEQTARKVACLLNKSVTYEAKKYRDILSKDEVKGRDFSTEIKMLPSGDEIAAIDAALMEMIRSMPEIINFLDPFKIRRVAQSDTKLAELLMRNAQKRFMKWQAETASKNSQENAEIQQASMQAKAEADGQLMDKQQNNEERNILLKGALDIMAKGVPVDPGIKAILDGVLINISMPLMAENEQMRAAAQQAEMEEQQLQTAA